jgi:hypothetical protein
MTKWLHVSAINEPPSGQFCSNDQSRVENFPPYGIPYGITRLLIVVYYQVGKSIDYGD